jgi:hypothetical protein
VVDLLFSLPAQNFHKDLKSFIEIGMRIIFYKEKER